MQILHVMSAGIITADAENLSRVMFSGYNDLPAYYLTYESIHLLHTTVILLCFITVSLGKMLNHCKYCCFAKPVVPSPPFGFRSFLSHFYLQPSYVYGFRERFEQIELLPQIVSCE